MISEFIILRRSSGYGNLIGTGAAAKQLLQEEPLPGNRNHKTRLICQARFNAMTYPLGSGKVLIERRCSRRCDVKNVRNKICFLEEG